MTLVEAAPRRPQGRPHDTRTWDVSNPPERIRRFVEAYVHDRAYGPPTHAVLAELTGYSLLTIKAWLRDERVVILLENALRKSNAGPVKVQQVLDMLHKRAVQDEDVKAAQLYLQAVDRLAPRRVEITHHDASGLSNQELHAELARALALIESQQGEITDAEVIEDNLG